jgi:hypothetical protein
MPNEVKCLDFNSTYSRQKIVIAISMYQNLENIESMLNFQKRGGNSKYFFLLIVPLTWKAF